MASASIMTSESRRNRDGVGFLRFRIIVRCCSATQDRPFLTLEARSTTVVCPKRGERSSVLLLGSFEPLEDPLRRGGRLPRVICERDINQSINLLTTGQRFR